MTIECGESRGKTTNGSSRTSWLRPRSLAFWRKVSSGSSQDGTIDRNRNSSTHRALFLIVAASFVQNLNTSQLTKHLFKCENFSTDCRTAYLVAGTLSFFFSTWFISPNFPKTLVTYAFVFFCHISYIIISLLGPGNIGRVLFTFVYAVQGALEPLMIQGCKFYHNRCTKIIIGTYVISIYFLNNVMGLVVAGWTLGDVVLGCLQAVLLWSIGSDTIGKTRLCLVLCLAAQALLCVIGWSWLLYLHLQWRHLEPKTMAHECKRRIDKMKAMVTHIPKVFPRLCFILLANGSRYCFYPTLIPFQLPLKDQDMLVISIAEGLCYFLGSAYAVDANEEIDVKKRKTTMSHIAFLLLQNAHLYTAIAIIWIYNVITISAVWTRRLRYIESFLLMFVFTIVQAFATGYLCTRGYNGCFPILKYYNKQSNNDGDPIVSNNDLTFSNVLGDISYGFDLSCCAAVSTASFLLNRLLNAHKNAFNIGIGQYK